MIKFDISKLSIWLCIFRILIRHWLKSLDQKLAWKYRQWHYHQKRLQALVNFSLLQSISWQLIKNLRVSLTGPAPNIFHFETVNSLFFNFPSSDVSSIFCLIALRNKAQSFFLTKNEKNPRRALLATKDGVKLKKMTISSCVTY